MANYVENDRGEMVIAVGAPGSIERARCEVPALIERINAIFDRGGYGKGIDEAMQEIRNARITSPYYTMNVLEASKYGTEGAGTVMNIVRVCSAAITKNR